MSDQSVADQCRINGNDAIKSKDYIKAWEEYTKGLGITPKDPVLWSNRSFACLKAGFPELALMDAYRVIELCNQDAIRQNESLRTVYQKGQFRYAESLASLGLPRLAATAYDNIITEDIRNHSIRINDVDRRKVMERRLKLSNISLEQMRYMIDEGQKDCESFLITEEDVGFYQFNGKYPWDNRPDERTKESSLRELQRKLDLISNNKLKIDFIEFDESLLPQLGIISKVDLKKEDIIMEEDPFLTIHNHYHLRCDYCFHLLDEKPSDNEEYPVKYPCPNSSCEESFCNDKCYRLAKDLYHDEICGKDIELLIDYVQRLRGEVKNNNILFILKLFAIAKKRNICPLDVEEIKHLTRYHSTPHYLENHDLWDADFGKIYLEILNILDISHYDLNFDFWIFVTLIAILGTNAFGGPAIDLSVHDTAAIFPLISLLNHNCDHSVEGQQYLQEWSKLNQDPMPAMYKILRKTLRSIGCHSYRMTMVAKKDIKKGEQLFITYCDPQCDKNIRLRKLLRSYGLFCHCKRCRDESGEYEPLPIMWCLYFSGDERGRNFLGKLR